ncbi:MAG TPA: hypothetical protein VD968_02655, partial [Pyrinomonadaceae bacterium]|nr:hypothetical protein [Pyrinomonadaceae bacterium]
RMASAGAPKRNGRPALFRLAFVPVAAAACLLVVAAGSLYVWQQRKTTPAVATQAGGDGGRARPVQVAESREGEGAASSARDDEGGADSNDAAPADADNNSGRGQKTVRGARRARAFEPARRASTTDVRSEGGGFEFTQHGASVIAGPGRTGQRVASATALRIPLRASAEPLEVLFRDERGALQRVPMRSVSFGSQEPVAGVRAKAVPASLKSREGVW